MVKEAWKWWKNVLDEARGRIKWRWIHLVPCFSEL